MWADKIKTFTTWTLSIVAGTALAVGAAVLASGHTTAQATTPGALTPSQSAPTPQAPAPNSTSNVRFTDREAPESVAPTTEQSAATPSTVDQERMDDAAPDGPGGHVSAGDDDD
jgi:hypothetical protein